MQRVPTRHYPILASRPLPSPAPSLAPSASNEGSPGAGDVPAAVDVAIVGAGVIGLVDRVAAVAARDVGRGVRPGRHRGRREPCRDRHAGGVGGA